MDNLNTPIQLQGYFKEPYQAIVQPNQIWPVSKYLLRQWLPYLKPAEFWLIIAARQLSYRNQNCPWFRAYDETLAKGAGLNTQTFRRLRRQLERGDSPLAQFLQVSEQKRQYVRRNGRLRPAETHYTIRLDDPLTPQHATILANWLKQHVPETITGETIDQLLKTAVNTPDLLETEPQWCAQSLISNPQSTKVERSDTPKRSDAPNLQKLSGATHLNEVMRQLSNSPISNFPALTVSELIPQLFGQATLKSKQEWGETAVRLQRQITQPERVHIETQYLRQAWLPRLSPGPALLLVYLRSHSYFNEETGEQRTAVQFQTGELEEAFGLSSRTLRRWLKKIQQATGDQNPLGSFILSLESQKQATQQVSTTYQINEQTPLIPEDVARYYQQLLKNNAPATEQSASPPSPPSTQPPPLNILEEAPPLTQLKKHKLKEKTAEPSWHKPNHDMRFLAKENRDGYQEAKLTLTDEGWRTNCSPQKQGDGQIKNHTPNRVTDKLFTTEGGSGTNCSPQKRGDGQIVQRSGTNCSSLKDLNHLIRSVKESIQSLNNKQQDNTYSVVAVGDIFGLMTQLEITGHARKTFQNSQLTLEQMMGWYLWASQQAWCQQPVAYTIQRVRQNEPPPALYQQFASLPWQTWQLYAVFQTARDLIDFPPETSKWSAFEAWGERFGHLSLDALPFGVGVGLETAVDRLLSASSSLIGSTQPSQPKKPVPNQATVRHPKSPSAPTWGGQQTVALPLMQAKTSRGQGELLLCEHPTPDLASVGRDTFAPTTDQLTLWQMTLHELALQLPKATFCNWLQGAKLMGVEPNGRFIVQLKNQYAKEWVDNRLAPTILRTWSALMGDEVTARFTC